jgi:ribosomal protein S18 acetylase RimI-like enzyme
MDKDAPDQREADNSHAQSAMNHEHESEYVTADGAVFPRKVEVEIREMEVDDIPAVFHLGEEIFTASETPTLYRTWDEFEITSLFNADQEYCFVAEMDDQLVGFALGTTVTKRKSAWKYGYLIWLGVSPEHQRQGIANRLFDHFEDKMTEEGVRIFMVDTEASNLSALEFFRKRGFGNAEEHIYLSMNPKTYEQEKRKQQLAARKHKNGVNNHNDSGYTTEST